MASKNCFNCENDVNENSIYCQNCGQKVDDNNLTIKAVFHEFIENYLSFDTRIGRTILPFLFKPGVVVSDFIQGRRVKYVNPFRFYLIVSLFFFFVLGIYIDGVVNDSAKEYDTQTTGQTKVKKEPSSLTKRLENFAEIIDSLESLDSSMVANKMDSLLKANNLEETINYSYDSVPKSKRDFISINSSGVGFNVAAERLKQVQKYRYDKTYSDQALLDTLQADRLGKYANIIGLQTIKLYRSDAKVITRFVLGNLSLGMIFLIPGLAFLFFVFYYKNKKPFVAHLIHSLEIHTFALFIYGLAIFLVSISDSTVFAWFAFLTSAVYLFFSLKKVYDKGKWATFWRFTLIGILYYFYWVFTITFGVIISFLLF